MKIKILGAGLSGCTIAKLLADKGHDVIIHEKLPIIGGLCRTEINEDGILYEPYGARTFHTKLEHVKSFVKKFAKFNDYTHRKGTIVEGILRPFPISYTTINEMPQKEQILKELKERPKQLDMANFETCMISMLGPTLYKLFIENYTRKMWGIDPSNLTSDWAPKRLELKENDKNELFEGQWQGLPVGGYTKFMKKLIGGIPIVTNSTDISTDDFDLVISSIPIDELLNYKFGKLPYRGLRFDYKKDEPWEHPQYGTINLPGKETTHIRKANFKILHQQESEHNYIQYQEPIGADENNMPMYPINTGKNNGLFDMYLKEIVKNDKIMPIGRLGLYKYLDMDKAIAVCFDMLALIEDYKNLDSKQRYNRIKKVLEKY